MSDTVVTFHEPAEMMPGLPALAARLGVEPTATGNMLVQMKDGRCYDVFAIINALLDRLDAATR